MQYVYAFIIYLFINFTFFYCIFLLPGPRQEAKKAEGEGSLNEGCLTELRIAISHFPTPSVIQGSSGFHHPVPIILQTFPGAPKTQILGHKTTEYPSVLKWIEMREPLCMVWIIFYCNKI